MINFIIIVFLVYQNVGAGDCGGCCAEEGTLPRELQDSPDGETANTSTVIPPASEGYPAGLSGGYISCTSPGVISVKVYDVLCSRLTQIFDRT